MGRRSKHRREIDLFNFSFLDILACVIGLLIFILAIVAVSGGGQANTQAAGRLANADHQLDQARNDAQLAAIRRERSEQVLAQRARDFVNPKEAAAVVRAQVAMLDQDKVALGVAAETAIRKLGSLRRELGASGSVDAPDPTIASIQAQLRSLDEKTAELRDQTSQLQNEAAKATQVQFYLPNLRQVQRFTFWVYIKGDRLWCMDSDDYESIQLDADSRRFSLRRGASGISISAMVKGDVRPPAALTAAHPDSTVLVVAVNPDAYESFRKLRQWAWKNGYSVNWSPHEGSTIVLTKTSKVYEQ